MSFWFLSFENCVFFSSTRVVGYSSRNPTSHFVIRSEIETL